MPKDKVLHSYLSQRSDFQFQHLLFLLKIMQSIRTHLSNYSSPLCLGLQYMVLGTYLQLTLLLPFLLPPPLPLPVLSNIQFLSTDLKVNRTLCTFFFSPSHKKDTYLCIECMYDKLIILYVVLVSYHFYFSCSALFHRQNDSLTQQIHCFSSKYMNKYIYSKLASRASYLYFLSLKYTVRC